MVYYLTETRGQIEIREGCLLVDEIVETEDFMQKVVVKASQYPTKYSNDNNRDDIHYIVGHRDITHIKHD